MDTRTLKGDFLGVDHAELSRLGRFADRLLVGSPTLPLGSSPRRLRAGSGLEFLDHASYADGNDPRLIDWRATARSREPVVRRYQDEALFSVHLCLDRSASMGAGGGAKWTLAKRIAVALAYLMLQAGNRVGLLAFSAGIERVRSPARGRGSFARLLAALAAEEPRGEGGASSLEVCAPLVTSGSSAVILSDFLTPDAFCSGLDLLLHRCCRLQAIQMLSPGETSVVGKHQVVLRDVETGERRQLWLDDDVREGAHRALAEHRERLRRHCRQRGIPLTQCQTTTPWREVILAHLRSLEPFHA